MMMMKNAITDFFVTVFSLSLLVVTDTVEINSYRFLLSLVGTYYALERNDRLVEEAFCFGRKHVGNGMYLFDS